jgi:choloylglycine hydrolase
VDVVNKDLIADGMNEKGLCVNVFYHPGYAEYPKYDPAQSSKTLGSLDVCQYLLTTCTSIEEVRAALAEVHIVGVVEPAIGIAAPIHLIVTEPRGKAIVIEFTAGTVKIYDAPLGVITNSPNYDWHMTNLRNYLNLSAIALPTKKIEEMNFTPLGGGSGMIGLPGDFTPPSRFVPPSPLPSPRAPPSLAPRRCMNSSASSTTSTFRSARLRARRAKRNWRACAAPRSGPRATTRRTS